MSEDDDGAFVATMEDNVWALEKFLTPMAGKEVRGIKSERRLNSLLKFTIHPDGCAGLHTSEENTNLQLHDSGIQLLL